MSRMLPTVGVPPHLSLVPSFSMIGDWVPDMVTLS
jgi:hypothetical protein